MSTNFVYLRPMQLVAIRAVGSYMSSAPAAWKQMFDWLESNGLRGTVNRGFGLAHDDPRSTPAERCRYDACIALPDALPATAWQQMMPQQLPGGAYHRHRHIGCHTGIGAEISHIRDRWANRSGLKIAEGRPLVEIYLDDPKFCAPELLRTDLCLPVAFATELEVA